MVRLIFNLSSGYGGLSEEGNMMRRFYLKVKSGGDWDYKLKESWESEIESIPFMSISFPFIVREDFCSPETFGNINYGYVGLAIGFTEESLITGGEVASRLDKEMQPEGPEDIANIKKGFQYYKGE